MINKELSKAEKKSEKALFRIGLDKAMAQCSRREFCVDDIRNKLSLWGLGREDADKVIKTLIAEKFIDESRYSAAFVRDKFKYNKWGRVKIAAHLRSKKIPEETINEALRSIDNDHYINFLKGLLEGHRRTVKAKNKYDLKSKLLHYGLSKGFESNLLYDILNDLDE
jgi:regulatory protein